MTNIQNNTYNTLIARGLLHLPVMLLFLLVSVFFIAGCESLEDPTHAVMQSYFDESKSLPRVSSDSVNRFSAKVEEFTTRTPAAKKDPLYPKIQENIKLVSLKITIMVNDEWKGEKVINY